MTLRPTCLVDFLVRLFCRCGWWRAAESISYRCKADDLVARIRWRSHSGNIFYLPPFNFIDRLLLSGEDHDPEVLDCLVNLVRDGDVVWDIGANIGFISLELAAARPGVQVCCFEPSPWISNQLLANARASSMPIQLFSMALSNREEILPIMAKFSRNVGQSGFNPNPYTKYDGTVHVATARGDDLIAKGIAPAPDIIKLDVEGHEKEALEGLRQQIFSGRLRAIVYENCEFFEGSRHVPVLLREAGFVLRQLQGNRDNWVATRSEK